MLSIRLRFNSWLPTKLGFDAITLYPFIFFSCDKQTAITEKLINHEWIHVTQIRQVGWFHFYSSYLLSYWKSYFKSKNQMEAYLAIPWEEKAYAGQDTFILPQEAVDTLARY